MLTNTEKVMIGSAVVIGISAYCMDRASRRCEDDLVALQNSLSAVNSRLSDCIYKVEQSNQDIADGNAMLKKMMLEEFKRNGGY